jgi:integrase-like protein
VASISTDKTTGEKTLQFRIDGKRESIRLGKIADADADHWKRHVEELIAAKKNDRLPHPKTSHGVDGLDSRLHRRLLRKKLTEPRAVKLDSGTIQVTLAKCIDGYIASRSKVKPATATVYQHTRRCLVEYFGAGKQLSAITSGDADQWRDWLGAEPNTQKPNGGGQGLSDNTVRRRCGIARQFFKAAVRKRLIATNAFTDMEEGVGVLANRERDDIVSRDEADKVINACPNNEWKLLFALSRFGGCAARPSTLPYVGAT